MRKSGTDESNVQMSDVLCDFCHREWTDDIAMIEGHHGSCICGNCLKLAYMQLVMQCDNSIINEFKCPLCLETAADRNALDRSAEPGWASPILPDVVVCRRCVKRAAGALHKDPDFDWRKPQPSEPTDSIDG
jgi:hypothetical protein